MATDDAKVRQGQCNAPCVVQDLARADQQHAAAQRERPAQREPHIAHCNPDCAHDGHGQRDSGIADVGKDCPHIGLFVLFSLVQASGTLRPVAVGYACPRYRYGGRASGTRARAYSGFVTRTGREASSSEITRERIRTFDGETSRCSVAAMTRRHTDEISTKRNAAKFLPPSTSALRAAPSWLHLTSFQ